MGRNFSYAHPKFFQIPSLINSSARECRVMCKYICQQVYLVNFVGLVISWCPSPMCAHSNIERVAGWDFWA